jgi:hypothetical protein
MIREECGWVGGREIERDRETERERERERGSLAYECNLP